VITAWHCLKKQEYASPVQVLASCQVLCISTTFLPPRDEIEELVEKMKMFHENMLKV
jgi:hypothetical protein